MKHLFFSLISIIGLFTAFAASATVYEEFETYNALDLGDQGSWTTYVDIASSTDVVRTGGYLGYAATRATGNEFVAAELFPGVTSSTVNFSFKGEGFDYAAYVDFNLGEVGLSDGGGGTKVAVRVQCLMIAGCSDNELFVSYFKSGGGTIGMGTSTAGWNVVSINFNASDDTAQYGLIGVTTTDYVATYDTFTELNWFGIDPLSAVSDFYLYVDSINSVLDAYSCIGLPYDSCTAFSDCYFNYAAGTCLPLVESTTCGEDWYLQFCDNSVDCALYGGTWYGGICYPFAPSESITNWGTYYAANSEYATPTAFIQTMASATAPFYSFIRSLSVGFGSIFNASSAAAYGSSTGAIVPTLRGYIGLVNGFFNNLPVAEIFLFSVFLLFASIVFQIIKGLIAMVKP